MKEKVGIISLGCDKNRVDSENMIAYLKEYGYEITNDIASAQVLIVNTCGFIESAKVEGIDTILEMAEYKNQNCKVLVVTGCLAQRYMDELKSEFSEIDIIIGTCNYENIATLIDKKLNKNDGSCLSLINNIDKRVFTSKRVLTTPYHYAYLKISEGCDNKCTYCAIPKIRGKYTSRPIEDLVDESKFLIDEYGIKELNIVAQDITRYGIDIYNEYSLLKLLDKLSQLNIEWIRLLYCYPELLTENIIKYISENPKLCKYIDIPLQHVSDRILKLMNRRTNKAQIEALIENIRKIDSNIAIRSTFIVGFPTESNEDFEELIDFIKKYKLDRAGFFTYSSEEGTAAAKLKDDVSEKEKLARQAKIYKIQNKIMETNLKQSVGKVKKVIYEGIDFDRQMFYGRTNQDAPEIDSQIFFTATKPLDIGNIYDVTVTKTDKLDLLGELKV